MERERESETEWTNFWDNACYAACMIRSQTHAANKLLSRPGGLFLSDSCQSRTDEAQCHGGTRGFGEEWKDGKSHCCQSVRCRLCVHAMERREEGNGIQRVSERCERCERRGKSVARHLQHFLKQRSAVVNRRCVSDPCFCGLCFHICY